MDEEILLHKILNMDAKTAAKAFVDVYLILGEFDSHHKRIQKLKEKYKGDVLLFAVYHLGFAVAIHVAYNEGYNAVLEEFHKGNWLYNIAKSNKRKAINIIEKEFKRIEEEVKQIDRENQEKDKIYF